MRQEVGDDEGEIVEWEARGTAQGADDRPFLVTGLPGQLVRPAGAVPAISHTTLAPFADGLGANAIALGQRACGLSRAGDLSGTHGRRGTSVGVDGEHQAAPRHSYLAQHRPMTEVSVPLRRIRSMRAIYC